MACRTGVLIAFIAPLAAFDPSPWIGIQYEVTATPAYRFQTYNSIAGANESYSSPSNLYSLIVNGTFTSACDIGAEVEFANTRALTMGTRSAAFRGRYQCLNDIAGDPMTLTLGFISRFVPHRNLADPTNPYQGIWNFSLSVAGGKEWSRGPYWVGRIEALIGGGHPAAGAGWLEGYLALKANISNQYRFALFAKALFGLGPQQSVHLNAFQGYAPIDHQSIDLGSKFDYHFPCWGDLSLWYSYRVYAKDFPAHLQEVGLAYMIPFSFF